jgi:hypothetical protein
VRKLKVWHTTSDLDEAVSVRTTILVKLESWTSEGRFLDFQRNANYVNMKIRKLLALW